MWTQHGNLVNSAPTGAAFISVCFGWILTQDPSDLVAGGMEKTGTHMKTPLPLPFTEKSDFICRVKIRPRRDSGHSTTQKIYCGDHA